jgi:hypothetical protein
VPKSAIIVRAADDGAAPVEALKKKGK